MNIRNIIFGVHLTVGITVGTVVLVLASTGMMLAFRGQIIDFAEHDIYRVAKPPATQERLSLQKLLDKIHEDNPKVNPAWITLNSDPHVPVEISLAESNALYVNPYTGVVLGKGSNIRHWFENVEYWHRWLGMKGELKPLGGGIKRVCNAAFFFMILTGFYLWWPHPWSVNAIKSLTQFNFKLKGQARDWNWHNAIGFWCAPFLVIISLTGIIMSYQWANNLLYTMTGNEPPAMEGQAHLGEDQKSGVSLEALFARAQQQVSDWKTITFSSSSHSGAPVIFYIEEPGVGHYSQLTLNRMNAQVIKWEPYSSQNAGRKLSTLAYYLHTGEAGGWIGQAIVFFASCGLLLLVWTGFAKAWRRFFMRGRSPDTRR